MAQLVRDHLIIRRQLKGPFEIPDGSLQFATPLGYLAHPHPGKHLLRVGAEHALEHVGGVLVSTRLQHGLSQHPVGSQILRILFQDMLPVSHSLVVVPALNRALDLLNILGEGNLVHRSPPTSWLTVAGSCAPVGAFENKDIGLALGADLTSLVRGALPRTKFPGA